VDAPINEVEELLYARVMACQKDNIAINHQFLVDQAKDLCKKKT
jgi:hypothetical protein